MSHLTVKETRTQKYNSLSYAFLCLGLLKINNLNAERYVGDIIMFAGIFQTYYFLFNCVLEIDAAIDRIILLG